MDSSGFIASESRLEKDFPETDELYGTDSDDVPIWELAGILLHRTFLSGVQHEIVVQNIVSKILALPRVPLPPCCFSVCKMASSDLAALNPPPPIVLAAIFMASTSSCDWGTWRARSEAETPSPLDWCWCWWFSWCRQFEQTRRVYPGTDCEMQLGASRHLGTSPGRLRNPTPPSWRPVPVYRALKKSTRDSRRQHGESRPQDQESTLT